MEINEGALESALESIVNPEAPKAPAAPAPVVPPAEADAAPLPADDAPVDGDETADPTLEGEQQEQEAAAPEPEFEIVYNGQPQKITGKEQITELLQKGLDYSQKSEYTARLQETVVAQAKAQQEMYQFQSVIMNDVTELQNLRAQMARYDQIDWNAAIDSDFTNAMKLQEQRNAVRAQLMQKEQEINGKAQQFKSAQDQFQREVLASEGNALLAKLPAWRNSLKAKSEQDKIKSYLSSQGMTPAEINGLTSHVHVLIARDAMLYRELKASQAEKLKQARQAPAMVKPGAAAAANSAATTQKFTSAVKQLGKQGKHSQQEALMIQALGRTFKT